MDAEEQFVTIAALMCEPSRAKMLWNLLDGRAYTASELAAVTDISATATSNHLAKLLEGNIIKFEMQGRHRYYTLANAEVAYVVEALANLSAKKSADKTQAIVLPKGIKYCRTCYDHLAGYAGVKITEEMEQKGYLKKSDSIYVVTKRGWQWFSAFNILQEDFSNNRRPLTRQCLDWSERRPHLAGQLGAVFLQKMILRKWFKRVQFSREMIVTSTGSKEVYELLGITL
jgi:DNA-binding transcriptional ArsR family regulator